MATHAKQPTITVGIPAHNEEANIADLLRSILAQQGDFTLERIIVACDGCTDRTAELARATGDGRVEVRDDGKRLGKATRLNELYAANTSELLLTLDGDILISSDREVGRMAALFVRDPEAQLAVSHVEPVLPEQAGFVAKVLYTNYVIWNAIVNPLHGGDHVHNVHGPASILRRSFAATVRYPEHITCDEGFLYLKAKELNGFRYAGDVSVYTHPLTTLGDVSVGVPRVLNERLDLVPYFGPSVLAMYHVPFAAKVRGVLSVFMRHPILTAGALAYNGWIKLAFRKNSGLGSGVWEQVRSTKRSVIESIKN